MGDGAQFKPDFSAYIASERLRYVSLTYTLFHRIISGDISASQIPRSRSSYGLDFSMPSRSRQRAKSTIAPQQSPKAHDFQKHARRAQSTMALNVDGQMRGMTRNRSDPSVPSPTAERSSEIHPAWIPRSESSRDVAEQNKRVARGGKRSAAPDSQQADFERRNSDFDFLAAVSRRM